MQIKRSRPPIRSGKWWFSLRGEREKPFFSDTILGLQRLIHTDATPTTLDRSIDPGSALGVSTEGTGLQREPASPHRRRCRVQNRLFCAPATLKHRGPGPWAQQSNWNYSGSFQQQLHERIVLHFFPFLCILRCIYQYL